MPLKQSPRLSFCPLDGIVPPKEQVIEARRAGFIEAHNLAVKNVALPQRIEDLYGHVTGIMQEDVTKQVDAIPGAALDNRGGKR